MTDALGADRTYTVLRPVISTSPLLTQRNKHYSL